MEERISAGIEWFEAFGRPGTAQVRRGSGHALVVPVVIARGVYVGFSGVRQLPHHPFHPGFGGEAEDISDQCHVRLLLFGHPRHRCRETGFRIGIDTGFEVFGAIIGLGHPSAEFGVFFSAFIIPK